MSANNKITDIKTTRSTKKRHELYETTTIERNREQSENDNS